METNELDNPTNLNPIPRTSEEIMATLGLSDENKRKKEYVTRQLTKLEAEAWEHEDTAEYTMNTMLSPIQQAIDQNRIAIARHEEIIEEITRSGSYKREDRDRKKASQDDIKLLQKDNTERGQLKKQVEQIAAGRKAKADETRLNMKFLADKYKHLFEGYKPEPEGE
jgi:hypothetical protein